MPHKKCTPGPLLGPRKRFVLLSLLLHLIFIGSASASNDAAGELTLVGPDKVREGYFQLRVEGVPEGQSFRIEQSNDSQFNAVTAVYQPVGAFQQLSLSGFADGVYYFRAVREDGQQSASHQLEVEHYPLWQALSLFAVGGLLFIAFVVTLLLLNRRSARAENG